MNAEEKLAARREAVDRELERLLEPGDSPLFQSMRYAVLSGGKRFRPLLLLSAGEWFKVERSVLLPFACALEFIHNYSLIHDDLPCMDDDDVRRGRPSCHKAFGEDIALLAGDALLTLAFEVLAEAPLPAVLEPQRAPVIREIGRQAGARGMIEGQCLDIRLAPETLDETSYRDLILKKTGGLIIASVKCGGLLGRASAGELQALVDYGTNVGLAFQVRDDILDAAQELARPELFRPNSVMLFGQDGARRRLEGFAAAALAALDRASIASEELRALASKLLVVKEGTDG
jgi:geranylgeranyl diphosphate synthase, type II